MMKNTIASLAAAVASTLVLPSIVMATAMPIGESSREREYLIGVDDLHNWSAGVYFTSMDREMKHGREVSYDRTMCYVGYDATPIVTAYIGGGVGNSKIESVNAEENFQMVAGMQFNILHKEVLDPTLIEDKIRVTANIHYHFADADYPVRDSEMQFDEFSASLLVTVVNDLDSPKSYYPNSIALFAGPLYSDILTDNDFIDEEETVGFIAGLEVFYTESVTLSVAMEKFESTGVTAGLNLRF